MYNFTGNLCMYMMSKTNVHNVYMYIPVLERDSLKGHWKGWNRDQVGVHHLDHT